MQTTARQKGIHLGLTLYSLGALISTLSVP